jgi:hypothetical protein
MRLRPLSLLGTLTLAALWGCPVGNALQTQGGTAGTGAQSSTTTPDGTAGSGSGSADASGNTAAHDDPVDSLDDVSWVQHAEPQPGVASLRILLTDAPLAADKVFVTICGVDVAPYAGGSTVPGVTQHSASSADAGVAFGAATHGADAGAPAAEENWETVSNECQTVDLLTLRNGVTEAIGVHTLPPGPYAKIRLLLTDASVVSNGLTQHMTIVTDADGGVTVDRRFDLIDGKPSTITLDFDAGGSVHYVPNQGVTMTPVIKFLGIKAQGSTPAAGADAGVSAAAH